MFGLPVYELFPSRAVPLMPFATCNPPMNPSCPAAPFMHALTYSLRSELRSGFSFPCRCYLTWSQLSGDCHTFTDAQNGMLYLAQHSSLLHELYKTLSLLQSRYRYHSMGWNRSSRLIWRKLRAGVAVLSDAGVCDSTNVSSTSCSSPSLLSSSLSCTSSIS